LDRVKIAGGQACWLVDATKLIQGKSTPKSTQDLKIQ